MLFAHAFDRPNLLAWIRRHRKSPLRVYGLALGLLTCATLLRLGLHQQLSTASPFTAYGVPVLCVSLVGGFWPGMVTLAASLITGSILFLPPAFSFALAEGAAWPLLMFAALGIIYVVLISGMMASILLHDEHQQFLFGELRHRSRNLFAVVQGMVSRTLMESASLRDARQALETRLASLARTHAMLADNGWTGAPLDQIVSEELTSFANQVDCAGCELILDTPAAQSFSLIIHELATNAVKHGALSRQGGRVAINGSILSNENGEVLRFVWTESGGPAVSAPGRKGFGSSILNTMAKRFACGVEADFRPEGLVYELQVPLHSVLAPPQSSQSHRFWKNIEGFFPASKPPVSATDPAYATAQRRLDISTQKR
ncbi:HWE histidine kinase domain-containing protein [Bradyrhizobium sp. PMVTL-01]|uniref:HWE histidine kinase domain-containing protein n=1 Tax=Bradyrhizobium sp. PMVTL-01 TaxID=3434999 RepID=UPI003F6FF249